MNNDYNVNKNWWNFKTVGSLQRNTRRYYGDTVKNRRWISGYRWTMRSWCGNWTRLLQLLFLRLLRNSFVVAIVDHLQKALQELPLSSEGLSRKWVPSHSSHQTILHKIWKTLTIWLEINQANCIWNSVLTEASEVLLFNCLMEKLWSFILNLCFFSDVIFSSL